MEDFHELYECILKCLEGISHPNKRDTITWDTQSMTDASGLLKQIRSSEFLVFFMSVNTFLDLQKIFPNYCKEKQKILFLHMKTYNLILVASLQLVVIIARSALKTFSKMPLRPGQCPTVN